jgi:hypothetical protein
MEHCCYLLESHTDPHKAFVGYTNKAPQHRLEQHNCSKAGGAKPTQRHRPWRLVAVVSGFASKQDALEFEYGWQRANVPMRVMSGVLSRKGLWRSKHAYSALYARTRHLASGANKPAWFLRVLDEMMVVPQWAGMDLDLVVKLASVV